MGISTQRLEDMENTYRCGRCGYDIPYGINEEPVIPCPECGWAHKQRKPSDVPSVVKLDLTKYGG